MKKVAGLVALAALTAAGVGGAIRAQEQGQAPAPPVQTEQGQSVSQLAQIEREFVRLGEEVRSYVVNIDAKGKLPEPSGEGGMEGYEDLFKYFFNMPNMPQNPNMPMPDLGRPLRPPVASGSGFIYDKQGHIITNNHVVENADEITVRLMGGKEYSATLVGTDPDTDVAVVKIEPDGDLPVAPLGDSDSLRVGQFAIAAGSPRGLEGSVSFGHISALGRNELDLPGLRFQNFIQTDAAINLGNSGGPLANVRGEVIGINTAIVFGAQSLGFAIPINTAKRVVPELISKGRVTRGYLGVQIRNVDDFAEALGLPDDQGAFVEEVQPDTPAARSGVKNYDVIRKINGQPVRGRDELVQMISETEPGSTVTLEVWRERKPVNIDVKLDEWQPDMLTAGRSGPGGGGRAAINGITVQPLVPEMAERLQLEANQQGVIVVNVQPGSAAAEAGIRPGDVITEIAQKKVTSVPEFRELMGQYAKPGSSVLIRTITQGGQPVTRVLKVPAGQ
jgi:serine protease Do